MCRTRLATAGGRDAVGRGGNYPPGGTVGQDLRHYALLARSSQISPAVRFGLRASQSRSCSSASAFSSHAACFSATHLSADLGLWPMTNSAPQPSHLSVPISWKPVVFSRLLFFIATAYI